METGNKLKVKESFDEHFDLSYSNEPADIYILILEIGEKTLKACWYHKSKNLITGFGSYDLSDGITESSIKRIQSQHPYLASPFSECLCVLNSRNYTIAPTDASIEDGKKILSISNEIDDDSEMVRHKLLNTKGQILQVADTRTLSTLDKAFPNIKFISCLGGRIESAINQTRKSQNKSSFIAHIDSTDLHIIAIENSALQLANSFFQTGKEDIAYYLLFVAESLGLNPEQIPLTLSGNVSIGDEIWNTLSDYWKDISIESVLENIIINQNIDSRHKAKYDYLSHHLLCAS